MTNQEAIIKLTNIMHDDHYAWHPSILTAFGMAVDALRQSGQAEPCEDAVSKKDVVTMICEWGTRQEKIGRYAVTICELKQNIADMVDDLPSAQPELPIRCKDCKYFAGEGMYCDNDIIVMFDHFYCYHAERKEGEADD